MSAGDLPSPSAQRWLLKRLGELIQARGYERFLESPLREPSAQDFPDRWTPDVDGVRAMLQRLLLYAGLGMHQVDLQTTGTVNPVALVQESGGAALQTAAWFAGSDGQRLRFGCNLASLQDPEQLAGILAHEVSHAYRHHHGLDDMASEAEEESLTDLTTVFLGFGILTTNIAGMAQGTLSERRSVGTRDKGYLSALEMAFLLAAQVVARGADRRPIAEKLRSSPRRYFLAACAQLQARKRLLLELLGVPIEVTSASRLFNAGKMVFPVRSRARQAVLAGAAVLGAGVWGAAQVLPLPVLVLLTAAGALALGVGWWRLPRYRCSHPSCQCPLRLEDLVCGNCGGQVAGAFDRLRGTGSTS